MDNSAKIQNKIITFIILPIMLVFVYYMFNGFAWNSNAYVHIILEIISTFIALFVSILALVQYYYNKNTSSLIIGCGYLSVAALSIFNALISSSLFIYLFFSEQSTFIFWSEFISRFFLAGFLCISLSLRQKEKKSGKTHLIKDNIIYATTLILITFFIQLLTIVSLPPLVCIKLLSFIPTVLFIYTLAGYFEKGDWKNNNFEYWLILSLFISISQILYDSFSFKLFDTMFIASHFLDIASYGFVVIGLLIGVYNTLMQEKYNENRISTILNNMQDGVITINPHCIIESSNPAMEEIFGYSPSELINMKFGRLLADSACLHHKEESFWGKKCLLKKTFENNKVMGKKKNGIVFPVEIEISEISFNNKPIFILVIRDITQRKEIEIMKNEFISIVSHELRTPLTSIRGALGLIASNSLGEIPEKIKDLVDIAHNNSLRLGNLINDILDIEKIEAGKMDFLFEPLYVMEVVEQAIEANRPYAHQFNVKLLIEKTLPAVKIKADKDRIMQVLANLLSNASKFSPEGGTVAVSVVQNNTKIRISVKDNGDGIPEKFHDSVFKKFAQMDSSDRRAKGGTGLGLNICKAIVEKLGGSIGFETRVNEGSTFYFDLPEYIEDTPSVSTIENNSGQPKILICEDDKDVASLIKILFEQSGYSSDIAYNAEQTKQLLFKNNYDVVTIDLILPDKDGITLIKEIRENEKTKNIPIIVVSIKANESSKELNGDLAVIDWINKPIDHSKLLDALKRAVSGVLNKPKILHVEDDTDVLMIVSSILQDTALVSQAKTFEEARNRLENEFFDIVMLDIELPDGNGLDLLPLINQKREKDLLTVVFSAHDVNEEIAKNVDAVLLKSKTSNQKLLDTIKQLIETNKDTICK